MKANFCSLHKAKILVFCTLLMIASTIAQGQRTESPPFLKLAFKHDYKMVTLEALLADLHGALKINAIVDGVAAHKADLSLDGTVFDALEKISAEYDCSWRIGPGRIVLFTRLFRKPDEMPQIYLPEMLAMVKQINQSLRLAEIDTTFGHEYDALGAFAASLTDDQRTALKSGKRLTSSDFSGEQLRLMGNGLAAGAFASMVQIWQKTESLLGAMPDSTIQAKRQNTGKPPVAKDYQIIHVAKPKGESTLLTFLQEYGYHFDDN